MRAVLLLLSLLGLGVPLAAQDPGYLAMFDFLRSQSLRSDSAAQVKNLTLTRDSLRFQLDSGTIYFTEPLAGRTFGAVFVGRGSVSIVPAYDIERRELRRVLHDTTTSWAITAAAFLALDSTTNELRHRSTGWHPGSEGAAGKVLGRLLDHTLSGRGQSPYEPDFLAGALNRDTTGYVLARVTRPDGEDLTFRYDVRRSQGLAVLHDPHEGGGEATIAEFPVTKVLGDSEPELDDDPDVRLGRYSIDAILNPDHAFRSTTVVRFTTPRPRDRWVQFGLSELLDVDSLQDADGKPVPYFRTSHNGPLWIDLPDGRHAGDTVTLRFVDHGNLIGAFSLMDVWRREDPAHWQDFSGNPDKWLLVQDCSAWYPRYDYNQPAEMDFTYRVPSDLRLAATGGLVDSTRSGDTVITRWHTERPTVWACFNVGKLQERHLNDPRIPPVVVQTNADAHGSLDRFIMQQEDALGNVTADVANSLSFFSTHFGPPLYSRYYATEVPTGYGEAFPGMILLSFGTYITMNSNGFEEMFRSHEMAHQWWGVGIGPAGERDAWLQEGFANFAALWYMQLILNDTTKFDRQLNEWRDSLQRRGPDISPLGVGFRVGEGSGRRNDYDLIVYRKGTWILQMLRNFMLNLHTLNEDAFTATMRDFYARYRGRKASIQDFQRVVEEHVGHSMDWFFDEWVNGSAIPTYTFSWHADTAVNGKFPLHLRVRQENVPDDFFMPVPVEIQFAGGRHVYLRLNVRGPLTDGQVTVPEAPTAVNFNPLESVLATVKTESWRDKP